MTTTTPPTQGAAPPLPPLAPEVVEQLQHEIELLTRIADDPRPGESTAGKLSERPLREDTDHAGKIRHTAFMWLPGGKLMLFGPIGEVRQIVALQARTGRVVSSNDPAPAGDRVMVTLTMASAVAPGRYVPSQRVPTATAAENGRVVAIMVGGLLGLAALGGLVMWINPVIGWIMAIGLLGLARLIHKRTKLATHRTVPHVAIHHDDKHRPDH